MILISGPAIARLRLRTRKWAHEAISRGDFGADRWIKGIRYVDVEAVERRLGTTFSEAQLAYAAGDQALRVLTIPEYEDSHGTQA